MMNIPAESNHVYELVYVIVRCFWKVRLSHLAKEYSAQVASASMRRKLTNLIHFNNQ